VVKYINKQISVSVFHLSSITVFQHHVALVKDLISRGGLEDPILVALVDCCCATLSLFRNILTSYLCHHVDTFYFIDVNVKFCLCLNN
jgi:hypothetical protein